jgi:trimeric autotransporter adhesin
VPTKSNINQDYIQPGQGFIVKSKVGGGSISFTQAMRYHDISSMFFKKSAESPWPFIQLQVSSDDREASTLIAFNYYMTRGLDPTYDAGQFGADAGFNLYTRLVEDDKGVKFAIQALPDYGFEDMVIPVGFDFAGGGEVTFSVADLDLPAGALAILEDRDLDVFTDLEKENYTVSLDQDTEGPGRFFLHTDTQITSVEDIIDEAGREVMQIYSFGKEVFILGEVPVNSFAALYDLTGRQVKTQRLMSSERNSFRVDDLERGVYIVKVSGTDLVRTARIFIE